MNEEQQMNKDTAMTTTVPTHVRQLNRRTMYRIDPERTQVHFTVKNFRFRSVKGHFTGATGTIVLDEEAPERSRVEAEIDASSIDTRLGRRDHHLRAPDFLDVVRYPRISFRSTRVEQRDEQRFAVTGDLTIRGVSNKVTLDATLTRREPVALFTATATVARRDFDVGLRTPRLMVGDDLRIYLEVVGERIAGE
jgi:polyisoprenoid-binding protein YceI